MINLQRLYGMKEEMVMDSELGRTKVEELMPLTALLVVYMVHYSHARKCLKANSPMEVMLTNLHMLNSVC
jgi:hypothetical protein